MDGSCKKRFKIEETDDYPFLRGFSFEDRYDLSTSHRHLNNLDLNNLDLNNLERIDGFLGAGTAARTYGILPAGYPSR
jgi:hypothetical protein